MIKIGPVTIEPMGIIAILAVTYWSVTSGSLWPIIGFAAFLAILTPFCIWATKHSAKQDRKLADDFPWDAEIQRKYGYRTYTNEEQADAFARLDKDKRR